MSDNAAPDATRMQARHDQQRQLEQRRSRHLRLAVDLAADEQLAARLVARARERVELWRSKRSCSPFYIERWSEILALPPRKLAKAMVSLGEWEDAMFQNSPWSWAWKLGDVEELFAEAKKLTGHADSVVVGSLSIPGHVEGSDVPRA